MVSAQKFCRKAHVAFRPPWNDGGEFWKSTATELLIGAIDLVPDRFDAVVVDEGQDFYADWWMALEMINRQGDKGPFYIFYDPAQNLFVEDNLSIPISDNRFPYPQTAAIRAVSPPLAQRFAGSRSPFEQMPPMGPRH